MQKNVVPLPVPAPPCTISHFLWTCRLCPNAPPPPTLLSEWFGTLCVIPAPTCTISHCSWTSRLWPNGPFFSQNLRQFEFENSKNIYLWENKLKLSIKMCINFISEFFKSNVVNYLLRLHWEIQRNKVWNILIGYSQLWKSILLIIANNKQSIIEGGGCGEFGRAVRIQSSATNYIYCQLYWKDEN